MLIDRIIFLEGTPEIARYDVIRVGTDVKEQFENDLELETKGVNAYNAAIALCIETNDGGSREMMERILVASADAVRADEEAQPPEQPPPSEDTPTDALDPGEPPGR